MDGRGSLYSKSLALASTEETRNAKVIRRSSNYHPSVWGDYFIVSTTDMKPDPEVEKRIEMLKEDISQALQSIYNNYADNNNINGSDDDDLYTNALRFRLLRQQGYSVSSDVFKKYVDDNGEFKATLANDARALLCLFESSNLRKEGEDILEQFQRFSTRQLKSMLPHLNSSFIEKVNCTLELPLHKRMPRLEARQYISIYEANAARNDLLLEIAKLDFNSLQKLHRTELCDLSRL
ncbi:beta-cubebene synthase-like [Pistacia vera]|uniref:beta-cubebene synthase-like n=1 Tax=Pistacia vera TaxID=55513 RepID=UPI0012637CCB|nr:beta-cubebene synthase-like [Pistacia vera]